jgi:hypothetical protein
MRDASAQSARDALSRFGCHAEVKKHMTVWTRQVHIGLLALQRDLLIDELP